MPGVPSSPGYERPKPDPRPDPALPALAKSLKVTLNDGSERSYSTIADYVDAYVRQGRVRDLADLIENHTNLVNEIFFRWVEAGQLGCLFAVKLSRNPRLNRWHSIVISDAVGEGAQLGGLLNSLLDDASASEEAAAVMFPDIQDEDQIVSIVNNLCADPSGRWYWTRDGIKPDPGDEHELIGIRWILKNGSHVNFVLGFADVPSMPLTRRSPFPALFLRITEDKRTEITREDGRIQVHLADLDSTFPTQKIHEAVSDQTKVVRANMVEVHMNNMAKAKVTFSITKKSAERLCPPKTVTLDKEQ